MDYHTLMDLAMDFGYELSVSGAETFRIEDSVTRILASYHVKSEVFAIPNCLIIGITTDDGKAMTKMRRIGYHGNNLDSVEKLNALSRSICSNHPTPAEAAAQLKRVVESVPCYSFPYYLLGNFLGAMGFSILFGCGTPDCLIAGICGILGGIVNHFLDKMKVNPFFTIIASAYAMALTAYLLNAFGAIAHIDGVIIGGMMILVPGLLFTNAMRDIIYGDTNSGINRLVQVILIAFAMALGTAVAWNSANLFVGHPVNHFVSNSTLMVTCIGCALGCVGFSILFNIHGPGGLLCALGGILTWIVYDRILLLTGDEMLGYFCGAVFASVYAEIMARVRKYPAISYLVVSLFPLIPGAGIYYTMNNAVQGDMEAFASRGIHTAAIAGVLAVGILLVSTCVRLYYTQKEMISGR